MRVSAEVQVTAAAIADVRVELGRREIGMAEHFLDAAKIGSAFEQVRSERVPQQVGVDPLWLQTCLFRQTAQDEKDARSRQPSTLRVEKELRPMTAVEMWATA